MKLRTVAYVEGFDFVPVTVKTLKACVGGNIESRQLVPAAAKVNKVRHLRDIEL